MNNLQTIKETMSSLQIAEITGREHNAVMRSIRNMEDAWEKINGCKFALVEYTDAKGERRPCYQLSKTECLYIATKFNDEARARLVLRWEELETERQVNTFRVPSSFKEALLLAAHQQEQIEEQHKQIECMSSEIVSMKKKTDYLEIILASKETMTITQIAQDYGMSAKAFNKLLSDFRIQYKVNRQWILYAPYISQGYVHSTTFNVDHKDGSSSVALNTEWRQKGRIFLYEKLKQNNILPLIER
ncbi:phage regulatory protein/antirepressor Ant [Bacteroides neonati]|uniref:phage regulatory protein/antirepressor Ant n=1 Tax=Bacteroides neonati TaxID=1347393 RepID=UPI0009DD97EE|nr:phage regulatory protein/antirepressor Ant [Bacteroides neonati]